MNNKMKCPFCKSDLIDGELKRYETITEHCFDPNKSEYPLRPTFICSGNCSLSKNSFWADGGSFYSSKYFDREEAKPFNEHSFSAIGSWEEYQDKKNKFAELIRKYLFFAKYKYACSNKIARFIFKFIPEPDLY